MLGDGGRVPAIWPGPFLLFVCGAAFAAQKLAQAGSGVRAGLCRGFESVDVADVDADDARPDAVGTKLAGGDELAQAL